MRRMLLLLIAGILTLTGCVQENKKADQRRVFRYNEASGISSLDPAFAKGQADIWACNQLYNGLVQMNDQLEVIPCVAKSWTISDDGKTYTFLLRNNVFFHDHAEFKNSANRKVVASDFVYSFNRILDPKIASPGSWVFNHVETNDEGRPSFETSGDSIFIIKLKNPFPPFTGLLTSQYCSVVPFEIVNHFGKDFRKNPVGTGAFKFKLWEERTALIFLKNDLYFETENGNKLPFIDAVSISFISDRQAAFLEFVKGNLDFLSGIDASYKDELLTRTGKLRDKYQGKFKMETCPYLNTEYLGFMVDPSVNVKENNPLKNPLIRKAINYGFDREKMVTYLRNGIGKAGVYGIVPPGLPSFDTIQFRGYHFDPSKTAALLKEAGFPEGKGLPQITMSTTREYQDLCEFIQGQLSESGIKIKLEVNQGAAHRELVAKQALTFFRGSWIADYPDAENYLSLFYSPNFAPVGPNYTHFKSDLFDEMYRMAGTTTNDSLRYEMYKKMDQLMMDEAPVVVLYYDQVVRLFQNNISGLGNNAMNLLSIKKVKKK